MKQFSYRNKERRWNGWGRNDIHLYEQSIVNTKLKPFLIQYLGEPLKIPQETSKIKLLEKVQESPIVVPSDGKFNRLNEILFFNKEIRIDYSFGQSFPDWIRFKTGWDLVVTDAVAFPENIEDLKLLFEFSKTYQYKMIIYGGGTSVVGHIKPDIHPAITVSMEKMNQLLYINKENSFAVIQAGANGPEIEEQLQQYGYRLGHYPQSFEYSTLGGWIATRSSGQQSLYYGRIEDLFLGGKVLIEDQILEIIPLPASSAGPELKSWILGSEGRTDIICEAIVKIRKLPEIEEFHGVFFKDKESAIRLIQTILQFKSAISMIRLSFPEEMSINLEMAKATGNEETIKMLNKILNFKGFDDKACMMIVGFTGTKQEVQFSKKLIFDLLKDFKGWTNEFLISKKLGKSWQKNRFSTPYLRNTLWEIGYGVDTLETCLPWENILLAKENIESAIKNAAKKFNENIIVYTHLSHVYLNGSSLYTTYLFRLKPNPDELYDFWKEMKHAASSAIVELKGTISHQHGVGKDHKEYLLNEKQPMGIQWIKSMIQTADPHQVLNNNNLL